MFDIGIVGVLCGIQVQVEVWGDLVVDIDGDVV